MKYLIANLYYGYIDTERKKAIQLKEEDKTKEMDESKRKKLCITTDSEQGRQTQEAERRAEEAERRLKDLDIRASESDKKAE